MLVKFHTRHGHLVMHGEPAVALLRLGGHSGTVPSAILAADLPPFLARLRQGLEVHGEEFSPAPPSEPAEDRDEGDEAREPAVKLRLRAVPFLDMVERAIADGDDLQWDKA